MKDIFVEPEVMVYDFEPADVICTSGGDDCPNNTTPVCVFDD